MPDGMSFSGPGLSMDSGGFTVYPDQMIAAHANFSGAVGSSGDVASEVASAPTQAAMFGGIGSGFGATSDTFEQWMNNTLGGVNNGLGVTQQQIQAAIAQYVAMDQQVAASYQAVNTVQDTVDVGGAAAAEAAEGAAAGAGGPGGWLGGLWQDVESGAQAVRIGVESFVETLYSNGAREVGEAWNGAKWVAENPGQALENAENAVSSGWSKVVSTAEWTWNNPGQAWDNVYHAGQGLVNKAVSDVEWAAANPGAALKSGADWVGDTAWDIATDPAQVVLTAATVIGAATGISEAAAGADLATEAAESLAVKGGESLATRAVEGAAEDGAQDAAEATAARSASEVPCATDPVDAATGDVVLMGQADVRLPGALPLVIARSHRSGHRAGRWLGPSWVSTLDQRLRVLRSGVSLALPDGSVLSYPRPPGDGEAVFPKSGPRWPLARDGDAWTVADPQAGTVRRFETRPGYELSPEGYGDVPLVSVTSRAGHQISFEYGPDGAPASVTHDGGYQVKVVSALGRVRALLLAGGASGGRDVLLVRYRYNRAGNLAEVINSSGAPVRFGYDPAGRLAGWADRNGNWYRYFYDEAGRCERSEGPDGRLSARFSYDEQRRVTTYTDAAGAVTVYEFTQDWRLATVTDALGSVTRSEYDEAGRLISRTDPLGRIARLAYDEAGNRIAVTRPDGSQSTADYNDRCQPVRVTLPDGAEWELEYDDRGWLTRVTAPGGVARYAYDERGNLVACTGPDGTVTTAECNAAGLMMSVTAPDGAVTRCERDAFGRITAFTARDGRVTRLAWLVEGKLAARMFADGAVERYAYDGEANLIAYQDPAGAVTRYEYGYLDEITARITPDGTRTEFGYDQMMRLTSVAHAGLTWRYEYDLAGRLTAQTDYDGATTRYTLDAAGQYTSRVNAAGQQVSYAYDLLGNLTEVHAGDDVATFTYDPAGRLARAQNADALVEFERDAAGRVIAETCNGAAVRSAYDAAGRRVLRVTPSGAETRWDYDQAGRPAAMSVAGQELRFGYDPAGREILRQLPGGVTLAQEWDPVSRLTAQVLTAGPALPATVQPTTAQPDSPVLGRLAGQGAAAGRVLQRRGYSYRDDGVVTRIDDLLTGSRQLMLDSAGMITGVTGQDWAEVYGYDEAGNVSAAQWPGTPWPGKPWPGTPCPETRGGAGAASAPAGPDARGPRQYSGTLIKRAGDIRYEHDPAGRIVLRQHTRLSRKPDTWRYEWDASERLTAVTTPDGSRWRYTYDPFGRRIAKQRLAPGGQPADHITFTWDGACVAEQATTGQVTTWDYKPGSYAPLTQAQRWRDAPQGQVDEQFYAIVTDLIGTPAELVSSDGDLAGHQQHTLWGHTYWTGAGTPLRFPGQYADDETGLHYNHHRYYDPATGRYLSSDPLGLAAAPNATAYVPNPTVLADPLGLTVCTAKAAQIVQDNVNSIKNVMTEQEAGRTTFAVAHVTTSTGEDEIWVSAAGKTGAVPGRITDAVSDAAGEVYTITNPVTLTQEQIAAGQTLAPHINDAEMALGRYAGESGATINAIGATRDVCGWCQARLPGAPFATPLGAALPEGTAVTEVLDLFPE